MWYVCGHSFIHSLYMNYEDIEEMWWFCFLFFEILVNLEEINKLKIDVFLIMNDVFVVN